jgi:hypothetical protein
MSDTSIVVNGVEYAPVRERVSGVRAVVVVDRGWIVAGDVERHGGRIFLTKAVWVFKWEGVGFSEVIKDPSKADIRKIDDVEMPEVSEIFSIPVTDGWGL